MQSKNLSNIFKVWHSKKACFRKRTENEHAAKSGEEFNNDGKMQLANKKLLQSDSG